MTTLRPDLLQIFIFADDGLVPNSGLPFIVYSNVMKLDANEPEASIERVFAANGWGHGMWRNGIFDYLHYHMHVHEVLGIARGQARVRFGGDRSEAITVRAGDVAILPAGTGHQCLEASDDLSVVGGYPPGPSVDITRATPANHAKARAAIAKVALPPGDPVLGGDGPLMRFWHIQAR